MAQNINHDTVELLKECSSGMHMGAESIRDVEGRIVNDEMRTQLTACRQKHERLARQADDMLMELGEEPGHPDAMARGMAWLKTNAKMAVDTSDATVADLLTDGCSMGVKSLNKYLNEYGGAGSKAQALAREVIALEEETEEKLREFL